GLFWLIWILIETVRLGLGGLALSTFTEMTPPPQADVGGLANAIFGSLLMVSLATLLGTPIGVLAGIYLAEYGQKGWLASVTRFINDILLSAPSIVIGLYIYTMLVDRIKHFSAFAGVLALALIVIPMVIRTTEDMLSLIPHSLREAAYALGTPKWKVVSTITLKAARAGVITEKPKLSVRNLNFYYGGFHALKRSNLDIPEKKVTAFIGPSGCGKSTLLRTFNRMFELYPEQRAEGEILLDGEDILRLRQDVSLLRAKVGMVFQKPTPFPM